MEKKQENLPKNVKQIGQVSGDQKVYIEDYVVTYLRQLLENEKGVKISVLLGYKQMIEDELYWFITGAVEAQTELFMDKSLLDEEAFGRVNRLAGRFFPDYSVMGWAIARSSEQDVYEQMIHTQKTHFRPDQKVFFEYLIDEKQENVFLFEKGKMKLQSGYYIYYDRNESMQNYMVSLRASERHPEELEADRVPRQFREVCIEKKDERRRRRVTAALTFTSLLLMAVIVIIGYTMLSNYEKMESMERVLYQISGTLGKNAEREETSEGQAMQELQSQTELAMNQENADFANGELTGPVHLVTAGEGASAADGQGAASSEADKQEADALQAEENTDDETEDTKKKATAAVDTEKKTDNKKEDAANTAGSKEAESSKADVTAADAEKKEDSKKEDATKATDGEEAKNGKSDMTAADAGKKEDSKKEDTAKAADGEEAKNGKSDVTAADAEKKEDSKKEDAAKATDGKESEGSKSDVATDSEKKEEGNKTEGKTEGKDKKEAVTVLDAGLSDGPGVQAQGEETTEASATQTVYIIKKGDTLDRICMRFYGNLSKRDEICRINKIENKDAILYGQKIILPQ